MTVVEPLGNRGLGPDGGYRDRTHTPPQGSGIRGLEPVARWQDEPFRQPLGAYSVPGSRVMPAPPGATADAWAGACVLGFDPSPSKLGWGVVHDDGGAAVDCGVELIDGAPENVSRALRGLDRVLRARGLEPTFGYMEKPGGRGSSGGFEEGVACGMVRQAARSLWPWLTIEWVTTSHWRSVNDLHTRAPADVRGESRRRRWLKEESVGYAQTLGFVLPEVGKRVVRPSDDAAEGGLIAHAAWLDLEANPEWRVAA